MPRVAPAGGCGEERPRSPPPDRATRVKIELVASSHGPAIGYWHRHVRRIGRLQGLGYGETEELHPLGRDPNRADQEVVGIGVERWLVFLKHVVPYVLKRPPTDKKTASRRRAHGPRRNRRA